MRNGTNETGRQRWSVARAATLVAAFVMTASLFSCDPPRAAFESVEAALAKVASGAGAVSALAREGTRAVASLDFARMDERAADGAVAAAFAIATADAALESVSARVFVGGEPMFALDFDAKALRTCGDDPEKAFAGALVRDARSVDRIVRAVAADYGMLLSRVELDGSSALVAGTYVGEADTAVRDATALCLAISLRAPWADRVAARFERGPSDWIEFSFDSRDLWDSCFGEGELSSARVESAGDCFGPPAPYAFAATAINDGTGDGSARKTGGSPAWLDLEILRPGDQVVCAVESGTFASVAIHARFPGGVWELLYEGEDRVFEGEWFDDFRALGATHLVFQVNGRHEVYDPLACELGIYVIPAAE